MLRQRFGDDENRSPNLGGPSHTDDSRERECIQDLEKTIWLRWLWFVFGTLPPAIKLLSMNGVPLTQTWALMFLTSWVANESLIVLSGIKGLFSTSPSNQLHWPGQPHSTSSPISDKAEKRLRYGETLLAMVALISHVVILNSVFRVLSRGSFPSSSYLEFTPEVAPGFYLRPSYNLTVSHIVLLVILVLSNFVALGEVSRKAPYRACLIFVCIIFLGNLSGNAMAFGQFVLFGSKGTVAVASVVLLSVFLAGLSRFVNSFVRLGVNLLIIYPDGLDGEMQMDYVACLALAFLLATVLAYVLWAFYVFDSTGTLNPSWTGVFG